MFLNLLNKCRPDEGIEVKIVVENRSCQANGRVNRVLEENVLVFWGSDGVEDLEEWLYEMLEIDGQVEEKPFCAGSYRIFDVITFHVFSSLPLIWFFLPLPEVAGTEHEVP